MGDANQLKVLLFRATLDDATERKREPQLVCLVQVRSRLIQREDTAIQAKGLSQGQANNDGSKDFLASRAPTAHVERKVALAHYQSVVVGAFCTRATDR